MCRNTESQREERRKKARRLTESVDGEVVRSFSVVGPEGFRWASSNW